MNQTIQTFYQEAASRNFARDFQLRITSFIVNGVQQMNEEDLVFLKTATLPGKTISVQNADFMGLKFNIPGSVQFDGSNNWQTTFYCTQDYRLRDMLEASMLDSFDQESSTGNLEPRDLEGYKIVLSLLDDKLDTVREYHLHGCFVTNLGAVNYNVGGAGAIQEIQASIAYQYWTSNTDTGISHGRGGIRIGGSISIGGRRGGITIGAGGVLGRATSILGQIGGLFGGRG